MFNEKKIYFVSGSWPPEICGVGDYMYNLSSELSSRNINIERVLLKKYSFFTFFKIAFNLIINKNSKVFISYPTEGFGRSFLPFIFSLLRNNRLIVHIHEYSSKNKYCQSLLRLFKNNEVLYFSNSVDYDKYCLDTETSKIKKGNWRVIPTPSNIPVLFKNKHNNEKLKIIHFGQIRPSKGLEDIIEIFKEIKKISHIDIDFILIGGIPLGYEDYANNIISEFKVNGFMVKYNLGIEEISEELSLSDLGVFYFPDGVDERRGSLIAALSHELTCFTTYSERTPENIKAITFGININDSNINEKIANLVVEHIDKKSKDMIDDIIKYMEDKNFSSICDFIEQDFKSNTNL